MLAVLSKYWWLVLLRGVWAILFGVAALVAGAFTAVAAIAGRKDHEDWVLLLLQGGIGIAFGLLTLRAPALTALALVLVVWLGVWALMIGGFLVVLSFRLRGHAAKAGA